MVCILNASASIHKTIVKRQLIDDRKDRSQSYPTVCSHNNLGLAESLSRPAPTLWLFESLREGSCIKLLGLLIVMKPAAGLEASMVSIQGRQPRTIGNLIRTVRANWMPAQRHRSTLGA